MRYTLERVIRGLDTISVTGSILRDYLTDLFSSWSWAPAPDALHRAVDGGRRHVPKPVPAVSAPKHVQQLVEETTGRWIRWASFWHWPCRGPGPQDRQCRLDPILSQTLDAATQQAAGKQQGAVPRTSPAGQPRQPVLSGPVLGTSAGCTNR